MANAQCVTLTPTEEKIHCFRLQSLVIDGGTLVLRHIFDKTIPPTDLQNKLKSARGQLSNNLNISNPVYKKYMEKLYPTVGSPPSSAEFDITLLVLLLKNICGLNKNAHVWNSIPPSFDHSLEADIRRLQLIRNEISHMTSLTLENHEFERKWTEYEQVILRMGNDVPSLAQEVQKLKEISFDPKKERAFEDVLQQWEEMDACLKSDVDKIKSDLKNVQKDVESMKITTEQIDVLKRDTALHEDRLSKIESREDTSDETSKSISMDACPTKSPLLCRTELYSRDPFLNEVYIITHAHIKAEQLLNNNGCVILSGLPGEGKTMMATKLLSKEPKGLKLSLPKDWDDLVLSTTSTITIFIDDIFGGGALDENLLKEWSLRLPDIEKALKRKRLKVIITTRHYILREAKERLRKITLFKDDNIQLLASFELSNAEKTTILEGHLNHENRDFSADLIEDCCRAYEYGSMYLGYVSEDMREYFSSNSLKNENTMIGFPEIVSLFSQNDHLFSEGDKFFEEPFLFFKKCMEELFLDEKKFLPLLLVWTRPSKQIKQLEVESPDIPNDLKTSARMFGFDLEGKSGLFLRKALHFHSNGYLRFYPKTGIYRFSHNAVNDMVGFVACQENKNAALEFADAGFLINYITTNASKSEGLHIYIEEFRFDKLHTAVFRVLDPKDELESEMILFRTVDERHWWILNSCDENGLTINTSILKHDCFDNVEFVKLFCTSQDYNYILSKPVQSIRRNYLDLDFGQDIPVYFPSLGLLYEKKPLLFGHFEYSVNKNIELAEFLQTNLLIAVLQGMTDTTDFLVRRGAKVSDTVIYIAAAKGHDECLANLLSHYPEICNGCSSNINRNSPLIAAAKISAIGCIHSLIQHGENVNYRNNKGWSALDKAVLKGKHESCKVLIQYGAEVNIKSTKFKRTPLHINADVGNENITNLLLKNGASIKSTDHRGHFPIHCAALRKNNAIVDILLKEDSSSKETAKRRVSYGRSSVLKGADLFHIAVYTHNVDLINILFSHRLDPNVRDFYGRSPLNRAVHESKKMDRKWKKGLFKKNNFEPITYRDTLFTLNIDSTQKVEDPSFMIIQTMLNKVEVNLPENNGYTPLHTAVHRGQIDMVKLIAPIANVNTRDKYGKTPLHTACDQVDLKIFQYLVEDCRADYYILTKKRESIFDILSKKTSWKNIRRKYQKKELVTYNMLEYPHFMSFRNIIRAKDPSFIKRFVDEEKEEPDDKKYTWLICTKLI